MNNSIRRTRNIYLDDDDNDKEGREGRGGDA